MPIIANVLPPELIALPQWVIWHREIRDGHPTKVPYRIDGRRASTTNPRDWTTFQNVSEAAARPGCCDGVGFAFIADDPYCGIDLDRVWASDADEGASWARGILERFSDTYGEGSPSDAGFKIWCRAAAPRCGRWPIGAGGIEVYDHGRYFAVTGRSNGVRVVADHQADIDALVENLDGERRPVSRESARVPIPEVIPQGQRHPTLVRLAGSMFRAGLSREAIELALQETNASRCEPPYRPDHIRQIVRSMAGWS